MEVNHLPVIDWELGIKLAGNKRDLAEDMLGLLVKNLREELITLKQLIHDKNYPVLLHHVHKLHGAICYCGVPRLKILAGSLETNLKSNIMVSLPSLFAQFHEEVNLLLEHYSHHQSYDD